MSVAESPLRLARLQQAQVTPEQIRALAESIELKLFLANGAPRTRMIVKTIGDYMSAIEPEKKSTIGEILYDMVRKVIKAFIDDPFDAAVKTFFIGILLIGVIGSLTKAMIKVIGNLG